MEPSDLSNSSRILEDVLSRRVKNRERQRRYRERKRLKTGSSNADVIKSSEMQIIPLLTNGSVEQVITRVQCRRDWKKDARRAHVANSEAMVSTIPSSVQSLTSQNHMSSVASGTREAEQIINGEIRSQSNPLQNDGEKIITKRRRRDWKADARSKK